jgi:ribosomal RNA-processing protein 7
MAISGFKVLPVSYPSSIHILYARSHVSSGKTKSKLLPEGRTLFLVNVPPDATERELILLFKQYGHIERIIFDFDYREQEEDSSESESEMEKEVEVEVEGEEQPRKKRKVSNNEEKNQPPKVFPLPTRPLRILRKTGRSAHVVFLDSSAVDRVLALPDDPRPWPTSEDEPSGLDHYKALYDSLRPPLDAVRQHADTSIELYDYELAKTKQKSKYRKGEAIVDEDGFTLVTRGGAYGQTLGGGVRVASKRFQKSGKTQRHRTKKKKGSLEKEGFYTFQKAEKQRKGSAESFLRCVFVLIVFRQKSWS